MMANLNYYLSSNIVLSLLLNQQCLSVVREVESAVKLGVVRAASEARLRQGENLYVR